MLILNCPLRSKFNTTRGMFFAESIRDLGTEYRIIPSTSSWISAGGSTIRAALLLNFDYTEEWTNPIRVVLLKYRLRAQDVIIDISYKQTESAHCRQLPFTSQLCWWLKKLKMTTHEDGLSYASNTWSNVLRGGRTGALYQSLVVPGLVRQHNNMIYIWISSIECWASLCTPEGAGVL